MRLGSICSGAGGLDLAVESVFGAETVWHCENDEAASKVLAHRWRDVPNHGNVKRVQWDRVEPIDILAAGFPCQDVSLAAVDRRQGLVAGNRSGLWSNIAVAIAALRPALVVLENVRGLLSASAHRAVEPAGSAVGNGARRPVLRAAGAVLGDLADLRYDAQWVTISAAAVGAPHLRERVFILANPRDSHIPLGSIAAPMKASYVGSGATAEGIAGNTNAPAGDGLKLLPTPSASDGIGGGPNNPENRRGGVHSVQLIDLGMLPGEAWEQYSAAIQRWEAVTRPAPAPVERYVAKTAKKRSGNSAGGRGRLNSAFSEWLMGWPEGWVTRLRLKREDELRVIGNGVVPQQAAAALYYLEAVGAQNIGGSI